MKILQIACMSVAVVFLGVFSEQTLAQGNVQILRAKGESGPIAVKAVHISKVLLTDGNLKDPMSAEQQKEVEGLEEVIKTNLPKEMKDQGVSLSETDEGSLHAVVKAYYSPENGVLKIAVFFGPENAPPRMIIGMAQQMRLFKNRDALAKDFCAGIAQATASIVKTAKLEEKPAGKKDEAASPAQVAPTS